MASRRKLESIGDYCYDKKEILGHGAFAIVFKGFKKQTPSVPVAVKCIAKKELSKSKELLAKEIRVLREISVYQHENVVGLLDVKETDSSVFLMIEFCNGGDLADYLQSKGTLSEDTLSSFMQQIASALNALNDKDIVHRDMKPQNILICYPKGGSKLSTAPTLLQLKIADFGFARFLEEGKMAGTLCGSPMYMAPEVIMSHKYDSKADLWSVGTIMFQCLTGKAPFVASTPQQLRAFYEKNVDLKPKIPENTSPELKDMLLRLLTRDATKRIGIKELLHHPFLKKFKRAPSKRGSSSSPSPIPSRRRTPSMSSDSSTPGSTRDSSPLSRQMAVDPDKDMVNTLTSSRDDEGSFTKVEKPDSSRKVTDEGFVMVSKDVPEYKGKEEKKKMKAPLAEEEYDAVDESVHNSAKPISLNTGDCKATFRNSDHDQQQQQTSPTKAPPPLPPRGASPSSQASPSSSPAPSSPLVLHSSSTAPIPVPSLSRTSSLSQQLRQKEGSGSPGSGSPARSKKPRPVSTGGAPDRMYQEQEKSVERASSETGLAAPDITQVSPPGASASPAACCGMVHTVTCAAPPTASSPMPIVPGSPPLTTTTQPCCNHPFHHIPPPSSSAQDRCRLQDLRCHRYSSSVESNTVPASQMRREGLEPCHRCGTEPDLRSQPFHSQHMLRAAYATHQQSAGLGALLYGGAIGERQSSVSGEKVCCGSSPSSLDQERILSSSPRHTCGGGMREVTPHLVMKFAAVSPPKLDNMPFITHELSEETLMDDEHNQTMAKLSFILDVVECVVDLARSKGVQSTCCNSMAHSSSMVTRWEDTLQPSQITRFAESQKVLEQLVLYLRAMQMMGQSISLAEQELKEDRLQYVTSLRNVLHQQNELYMHCIEECRKLYQQLGSLCKTPLTPQLVINTADKLIYNYAVEQCQAAALDELAGNTKECFQRYTTAQVLLHSLAQLARNDHDKLLLEKYRKSVEVRLSNIGMGSVQQYPCESCS